MTQTETAEAPQTERKNVEDLDYRDIEQLRRYVTWTGKILPRRITRLSAAQHRHITRQIKRARNMLLMK
jgi:small subunit ribosomal protein S18